jgi:hypothetical protein
MYEWRVCAYYPGSRVFLSTAATPPPPSSSADRPRTSSAPQRDGFWSNAARVSNERGRAFKPRRRFIPPEQRSGRREQASSRFEQLQQYRAAELEREEVEAARSGEEQISRSLQSSSGQRWSMQRWNEELIELSRAGLHASPPAHGLESL